MYCKPTPSDMGDAAKKSFSSGIGFGRRELGCKFGTTKVVVG